MEHASSARIWTDESSLIVTDPLLTVYKTTLIITNSKTTTNMKDKLHALLILLSGVPAAKMEFQDQLFSKFQDNFRTYLRYQKPQQIQIYYELSSTNQS